MSKQQKEQQQRIKIKRVRSKLSQNLEKLEKDREYYLDKARSAKKRGESSSYSLARSGLSSTLTALKRVREMLLNIDITTQMRDMGATTQNFLSGMDKIFKDISKVNRKVNLKETQKQLKKAMSGMENMQLGLDNLLDEAENGFSLNASIDSTVSDKELDMLIGVEVAIEADEEARALEKSLSANTAPKVTQKPITAGGEQKQYSYKDINAESSAFDSSLNNSPIQKNEPQAFEKNEVKSESAKNSIFKFKRYDYVYPPLDLLNESDKENIYTQENAAAVEAAGRECESILSELKVDAKVSATVVGPTFSRIEMVMPTGVSVNKVDPLLDDIAMRLGTKVRFQIPIAGKNAFGIEIPNRHRETIVLYDTLSDKSFSSCDKSGIKYSLAVNAEREPIVKDLTAAPHMIIAGSTNSGKSCFMHAVINSMMYKYTPNELKFVIVDFKRVEMTVYNKIPFLLTDKVIDNDKDALTTFSALVEEMESRYQKLLDYSCRNIKEYNSKCANESEKMPYIVLFVDEYADIATSAFAKEFDILIRQLSQKARASGIHLVLATQRPSTDIISGTIKNNFPTQVAFKVARKEDSRTTLAGLSGAEMLLGNGDLLFNEVSGGGLVRLQAPYISTKEIERVVEFVSANSRRLS